MKAFKRPNADPKAVPSWRHILVGYVGRMLGKGDNPNRTYFRNSPKPAKGKVAVKRAKRERRRLREFAQRMQAKVSA